MATQEYLFITPSNYTYNSSMIEVSSGARLKPIDYPDQDFTVDFDSDTGMTYDAAKINFTGSLAEQIDQTPTDSTCWVTYKIDEDLNFGGGILTATLVGGALVSGGYLDLSGGVSAYADYFGIDNVDALVQEGAIKFILKPAYSGTPAGLRNFIVISEASGDVSNLINIYHKSSDGNIKVVINDQNVGTIMTDDLGVWNPTAGIDYEFELNFIIDTAIGGNTFIRLFIDGIQFGITKTGVTGTRSSNVDLIRVGSNVGTGDFADHYIKNLIFFDAVQHTSNYTPGYTLSEEIYAEATITCPELQWTGVGTLISFDSFVSTVTGSPKFTLQIGQSGNYLYWNGSAWATSDGSYAQSTSTADFDTYGPQLNVLGEVYGQFKVHFPDTDTQNNITTFTASLTAQRYSLGEPSIVPIETIAMEFLDDLDALADSQIKHICEINGNKLYYNSGWVPSNGSYAQSNTIAEIRTNKSTLFVGSASVRLFSVFNGDGQTLLEITSLILYYSPIVVSVEFVIEDGTGKVDSTSYASTLQFLQYWENKGQTFTESDDEIKAWLNTATEYIDLQYNFRGYKTDSGQALEWPRTNVPKDRYSCYGADEIPTALINATCYLAGQLGTDASFYKEVSNLSSISYGLVSKTFNSSSAIREFPIVDGYLNHMLVPGGLAERVN